jgi:hypothetical protein
MLMSLLDVRDLLGLRLVSPKTKAWVDAVMPTHPAKSFTLYVTRNTSLHQLLDEEIANGIPFFRCLKVMDSSFFSNPLIPELLAIYGTQIHTVFQYAVWVHNVSEEVAFYQALPNLNLICSNTCWVGKEVPDVTIPSLRRLKLNSLPALRESVGIFNFDFLLNFPNLTHFSLPDVNNDEYVAFWSALGSYFKKRNGLEGSFRRTLIVYLPPYGRFPEELNTTEREKLAILLQELAVADGRILIEYMNVKLLDEAVRLFYHQREGQLLLSSFGKCIRSLRNFSSSLYDVELPNMRMLKNVVRASEGATVRDGDFSRTVSWPKLEEVDLKMRNEYLAKLVFGSGVFRPSVKRLHCDVKLISLGSTEAHLALGNFPNLTHLMLKFGAVDVGLFRSLMKVLPTSCPKIDFLDIRAAVFPLGDEDFLGVVGEEGLLNTPPLLQFPGK